MGQQLHRQPQAPGLGSSELGQGCQLLLTADMLSCSAANACTRLLPQDMKRSSAQLKSSHWCSLPAPVNPQPWVTPGSVNTSVLKPKITATTCPGLSEPSRCQFQCMQRHQPQNVTKTQTSESHRIYSIPHLIFFKSHMVTWSIICQHCLHSVSNLAQCPHWLISYRFLIPGT